jgi:hypothetical protein
LTKVVEAGFVEAKIEALAGVVNLLSFSAG